MGRGQREAFRNSDENGIKTDGLLNYRKISFRDLGLENSRCMLYCGVFCVQCFMQYTFEISKTTSDYTRLFSVFWGDEKELYENF